LTWKPTNAQLKIVLRNDPGRGVIRHADAGEQLLNMSKASQKKLPNFGNSNNFPNFGK
jgi:urocanate hydratase